MIPPLQEYENMGLLELFHSAVGESPSMIESPRQMDVFDPADIIKLLQFWAKDVNPLIKKNKNNNFFKTLINIVQLRCKYTIKIYLIIETLLFIKSVRFSPFSIPCDSNAKSRSWLIRLTFFLVVFSERILPINSWLELIAKL